MGKTKKILFWKSLESIAMKPYLDIPTPAKNKIPKWYKDSKITVGSKNIRVMAPQATNIGLKGCTPFLDSLEAGYILELPCDVIVNQINGFPDFSWSSPIPPITPRPLELVDGIPKIPGFTKFTQAWTFEFGVLLPDGYSLLVVNPLNHYELPFITTSGIVDADGGLINGAMPFALKEGFEGVLKKGTPIVQLIPFKRENWKSEEIDITDKRVKLWAPRSMIIGWYKKNIWKKKRFE